MYVLIGLGNPGREYEDTRHNLGFMVVNEIARMRKTEFRPARGPYLEAGFSYAGRKGVLVKPMTYMNNSGLAARKVIGKRGTDISRVLVIYDDCDLALGKIRFRGRGSHGGHKGLQSIIEHLSARDIPRLRIGVGGEGRPRDLVDFVLSPFSENELESRDDVVRRASEGALSFVRFGLTTAMNSFN